MYIKWFLKTVVAVDTGYVIVELLLSVNELLAFLMFKYAVHNMLRLELSND